MPNSPQIIAVVDEHTKRLFKAAAHAHQITQSKLLGKIIASALNTERFQEVSKDSTAYLDDLKNKTLSVRLTEYEHAELKRLGSEYGMSRSTYLSSLLRTHIKRKPQFTKDETTALKLATQTLSQLGRNVNQIARSLNLSMDETERLKSLDLQHMKKLIDEQRTAIKELLNSNLKGWGVTPDAFS